MFSSKPNPRHVTRIAAIGAYPFNMFGGSSSETIQNVEAEVKRRGLSIKMKTEQSVKPDSGMAVPGGILLPVRYHEMSMHDQATLLIHELTHLNSRAYVSKVTKYGLGWYAKYVKPRFMVEQECNAYGAGMAYHMWAMPQTYRIQSAMNERHEIGPKLRKHYPPARLLNLTKRQRARFSTAIANGLERALLSSAQIMQLMREEPPAKPSGGTM